MQSGQRRNEAVCEKKLAMQWSNLISPDTGTGTDGDTWALASTNQKPVCN